MKNSRPEEGVDGGNMVPFPTARSAAGTPMESSLVAPFLELPPSCAALAALANRARPAVRCRTAFPQKCRDCGGVGGAFYASDRTEGIVTPDDFSLVPPGGTVSFCKKEMVGPTVPRLEGGFPRPRPMAASLVPARGRNRSFQASGTGNPIPQSALLRPAPFTQGGLVRSRFAAKKCGFYANLTEFYSGFTGTKRRS